jgi:uncharacterized membrane protein
MPPYGLDGYVWLMARGAHIGGHPIHHLLVPLPIGLWVFSVVADVVFRAGGSSLWADMAFWTLACGIAGALVAAVPGFVDYLSLESPEARRVATIHMGLNLSLVVLFAVDLWLRTRRAPDDTLPFVLSLIGVSVLAVSGWLGGELVYRYGANVAVGGDGISIETRMRRRRGAA